MTLRREPRGLR